MEKPKNQLGNQMIDPENQMAVFEAELGIAQQMIYISGAFDSEPGALHAIANQVRNRDISPEEGINKIRGLLASRQDYH